jgi:4-hydroxythreonine-4-phosphate dehydrogenase
LHETTLWAVEPTPPPTSIAEALRTMRTALVPLDAVRGEVATLTDALRQAVAEGCAPVCDARDDADLDAVVAAAQTAFGTPLLVGSGALTAAAVRALPGPGGDGAPAEASRPDASAGPGSFPGLPHVGSLLMVLGTRTDTVAAQLDEVSPLATSQLLVDPTMLLSDPAAVRSEVEALGREGLALVAVDPAAHPDPTASTRIVAALADAVAAVADAFDAVFLAGGQTARAVLDRLGTDALEVVASLGSGTVVSLRRTTDGVTTPTRVVVTRPGSFGDADALRHVAEQLLATAAPLPARPASSLPAENDSPHPPSRTRATPEENR